ncbi:MAG TPA: MFS transporter [Polyangia bacterium]|nr:MFS transporter [Polyangia bacterium]
MSADNKPTHSPTWLFGVTYIPFGIVGGFCGTTMPFLARKAGVEVEGIGWFGLATMIPPMLQFLYAPIIDLGPRRKHWLILVTVLGAACIAAALMMPLPARIPEFLALAVAGQLISGLVGSCNGGILAQTLPDRLRGQAGGWMNTGNLGGAALGTWVAIKMTEHGFSPTVLGLTVAAMMIVPSLAALSIIESEREKRPAAEVFGSMVREVWRTAKSRPGWTGILLCISPVGSAALVNVFGGLAKDFHATDGMVAFVNGPASAVLTAIGSLLGGYLCDRLHRRWAYVASGALTTLCGLGMMAFPLSPTNYAVGVSVYLFVSGICYAAFSAVVLEAVGRAGSGASTQYTLFTSAGNAAIGYVAWLDTRFNHVWGPKAPLITDAMLNVVGIAMFLTIFYLLRDKGEAVQPKNQVA